MNEREESQADSALSGFESRIRLIDNIQPTLSLDDFAVGMPVLKCLNGRGYLHFKVRIKY